MWDCEKVSARCANGHRIDRNLICGESRKPAEAPCNLSTPLAGECAAFKWHRSVVIVAATFADERNELSSGFFADCSTGYIITVAHAVKRFSRGLSATHILIGIPTKNGEVEFCFTAEIAVAGNASNDSAVLKITGRVPEISEVLLSDLPGLKLASEFFRGEIVSLIGYNQEGEGVVPPASFVDGRHDELQGRVCKYSKGPITEGVREEIMVAGDRVIQGHSGGPCLNARGEVLGILSRHDCYNGHRWYLVPYWRLQNELQMAKKMCQAESNVAPEGLRGAPEGIRSAPERLRGAPE